MNFEINMTKGYCCLCGKYKFIAEKKMCFDCLVKKIKGGRA